MPVTGPHECRFYHTLELPISGIQHGQWDLRGRFADYTLGVSVKDKTVLDVGTASGFLSFEAEKRGATVVSVEAATTGCWDRLPFAQSLWFEDRQAWNASVADHLEGVKRSYWLAHREFGSHAQVYYGDVYDLPEALGRFDVVIVGQILVHLSDVIRAITSVSRRCADTLVIAEGMVLSDEPTSLLVGRADDPEKDSSFWFHSVGLYRELLTMLGFRLTTQRTLTYTCNVARNPANTPITTLVFERAGPSRDRPTPTSETAAGTGSDSTSSIEGVWRRLRRRLQR
jgi:SAM-dependent methyltransferase